MPSIVRHPVVTNLLAGRRILVEWELNDAAEGVTIYQVWRSNLEYESYAKIADIISPYKQYVDKVPYTFGLNFFYKVVAVDASGMSSDISQTPPVSDTTFDGFEEKPFRATTVTFDSFVMGEIPSGAIDGSNHAFTTASLFRYNTTQVVLNVGSTSHLLIRGTDYTEGTNQATLTVNTAPVSGTLLVSYLRV